MHGYDRKGIRKKKKEEIRLRAQGGPLFLYLKNNPRISPHSFFFFRLFWPSLFNSSVLATLPTPPLTGIFKMKFYPKTMFVIVILATGTGTHPASVTPGREDHAPGVQADSHSLLAKRQLVPVMHMTGLSAQDYAASHSLSTLNNEGDFPSALEKRGELQKVDTTA